MNVNKPVMGCHRLLVTHCTVANPEKDKLEAAEKSVSTFTCGFASKVPENGVVLEGELWLVLQPFLSTSWGSWLSSWSAFWDVHTRLRGCGPSLLHYIRSALWVSRKACKMETHSPAQELSRDAGAGTDCRSHALSRSSSGLCTHTCASWQPCGQLWNVVWFKSHHNATLKQRQPLFSNADVTSLRRKILVSLLRTHLVHSLLPTLCRTYKVSCPTSPGPSPWSMLPTHWEK